MTIVVTKKLTKKAKETIFKKIAPKYKLLNAKKFFGKLEWKGDPLKIQQEMRDE